jgi:hypothetical protein
MKTKRAAEDGTDANKKVKTAAIDPLPMNDPTAVIERFDVINPNTLKGMGSRTPRIDGHLYVRDKVVVVYCANHDMFYTREDIVTRRVLDYHHVILTKNGKRVIGKNVIILERNDNGDDFVAWEPEHSIHPNFVFRVPSSKHADELVYRHGGAAVNRRYGSPMDMPCYARKYDEVMRTMFAPTCCESPGERGMLFFNNRYYPQSNCKTCNKKRLAVRNQENRTTVEGKAKILAASAVSHQNARYAQGSCDTQLVRNKHQPIIMAVLILLGHAMIAKVAKALGEEFHIEPHQLTLDKIDDVDANYIGKTAGGDPILGNMALTVNINNPSVKLTGQQMARMVELSRAMKTGEPLDNCIDPQLLAALEEIRENLNLGKQVQKYKTEFTRKLANGLSLMCNDAKKSQNDRGEKTNRAFDTMDNSHVRELKKYIIALFIAQKGRCARSGHPITFVRRGACDESSLALPVSIDRDDNEIGYVKGNLELVCDTFQAEFRPSPGFENLRWTREFFKTWGEVIYSGGLTVEYGELPQNVRDALETKYRGCVAPETKVKVKF